MLLIISRKCNDLLNPVKHRKPLFLNQPADLLQAKLDIVWIHLYRLLDWKLTGNEKRPNVELIAQSRHMRESKRRVWKINIIKYIQTKKKKKKRMVMVLDFWGSHIFSTGCSSGNCFDRLLVRWVKMKHERWGGWGKFELWFCRGF